MHVYIRVCTCIYACIHTSTYDYKGTRVCVCVCVKSMLRIVLFLYNSTFLHAWLYPVSRSLSILGIFLAIPVEARNSLMDKVQTWTRHGLGQGEFVERVMERNPEKSKSCREMQVVQSSITHNSVRLPLSPLAPLGSSPQNLVTVCLQLNRTFGATKSLYTTKKPFLM